VSSALVTRVEPDVRPIVQTTMDLRDAVTLHQLVLASEGGTEATQRQYAHFERVFLRYLEHKGIAPKLDVLNPENVRATLEWYRTEGSSGQGTRGGEVAALTFVDIMRLLGSFLEREGVFADNPLRRVRRVKIAKRLRKPFTQTEALALWQACHQSQMPSRDEAMFLLLLDTGMRIGEACGLTFDHVRLDQRVIVIPENGKGRRERLVPIGATDKRDDGRTIRALRRYIAERPEKGRGTTNRLFLGRDRYPLESQGGSELFLRLGKTAKVGDAGPHRLRHTFATWYVTVYPGDELGLRRIIGHVSKEVLSSYVHFAQATIAERAGRASLAETLGTPFENDSLTSVPRGDRFQARGVGFGMPSLPHQVATPSRTLRTSSRRSRRTRSCGLRCSRPCWARPELAARAARWSDRRCRGGATTAESLR
jgi:integrase